MKTIITAFILLGLSITCNAQSYIVDKPIKQLIKSMPETKLDTLKRVATLTHWITNEIEGYLLEVILVDNTVLKNVYYAEYNRKTIKDYSKVDKEMQKLIAKIPKDITLKSQSFGVLEEYDFFGQVSRHSEHKSKILNEYYETH